MLRLVLLLPLFILGTGCMTAHWSKPGATAEQFYKDSLECAHGSSSFYRQAGWSVGGGGYSEGTMVGKDMYRTCMRAKGYEKNDPKGWEGFRD